MSEQVFDYVLDIPTTQPVLAYLESCRTSYPELPDEAWTDVRRNVAATVAAQVRRHGSLRRSGRTGLITAR